MPIKFASWSRTKDLDLHVLRGQTGPDLSASHLAFRRMDDTIVWARQYLVDPTNAHDVSLTFRPLIQGVLTGDSFRGAGVRVNRITGVVRVEDLLPPLHLRNFIVVADVTNNADGTQYHLPIRFHIHESVAQVWLTPPSLTIRPDGANRPDETDYKFSVRARFDDGVVGDLTESHGVTWGPDANVHAGTGRIFLTLFDSPPDTITLTATLPAALGGGSASGDVHLVEPWNSTNFASIVPGGGWPGFINPAVVPNFLFIGDGFTPADSGTFEQLAVSLVHRFKTSHLTTPFDLLATSMNFWQVFVPSSVRGISIRCEVYTTGVDEKRRGFMVPNPERPPDAGEWRLEHLIYAAGLPVSTDLPSNTARTNADIKTDWTALYHPDPAPHATDSLINRWRQLGNRSLVEEKDTTLGMAYGNPPRVNSESDDEFIAFHPYRLDRDRLDRFLTTLRGDQGHDLTALWAASQDGNRPTNYDYVFVLSSCKWDRGINHDGYIAMNVEDSAELRGLSIVSGTGAYHWDPPSIPNSVSGLRSGRALHEIAHSYGLGDEYALAEDAFTGSAADLDRYGNLQVESDAQTGGQLDGEQIKWNWLRARKGALVRDLVTSTGANRWNVKLQPGQGAQFAVGDKVVLRKRDYPNPLRKNPIETVLRAPDGRTTVLEIDEPRSADEVTVVGAINPDLTFLEGDVLYMPALAPDSVRSETYPFAGLVAKNIKDFITANHRPLTPDPCDPAEAMKAVQDPILNGVNLPICFSEKPRIVGLYHGGGAKSCGIFHPAGTCMMHGTALDSLEFCAVCRYVLVEIIDPFKHFQIDLQYDDFYPLR
ncbi:hypothetical protein [Micromonospora sp. NPDC000668]|uniref:hypothetical protein n=1 Tax=Micromonospora sp. NPDC000668 TaxID=3364219 RepID=UPI0036ADDE7C